MKTHTPIRSYLIVGLIVGSFLVSCDRNRVYEDFSDFDQKFWHQDSVVTFQFAIDNVEQPYMLKTLFRNGRAYPYHNMYYQYTLRNDKDSVLSKELKQIFLFDPKTGEPNGGGIGSTYDQSQVVVEKFTFPAAGMYSVAIQQYMRLDTLPDVLSVGWRVERATEK